MPVRSKWQSLPTEQINPATLAIDKLSPADIVEGMLNEDRKMLLAVQREKDRIAVGVEIITQAMRKNGRIIFVGAGTSGRLGALDAAELPPTFGSSPAQVIAVVAGGPRALQCSNRRRCRRPSAPAPTWSRRSWPAAKAPSSAPVKGSRTTTKKARARSTGCAPPSTTW